MFPFWAHYFFSCCLANCFGQALSGYAVLGRSQTIRYTLSRHLLNVYFVLFISLLNPRVFRPPLFTRKQSIYCRGRGGFTNTDKMAHRRTNYESRDKGRYKLNKRVASLITRSIHINGILSFFADEFLCHFLHRPKTCHNQ